MRRTDEAFKNEIYRRYHVAKRNRRNLRIYAATSLLLCVLVIGVSVPLVTGASLPDAVAGWLNRQPQSEHEPNLLSEYLGESVISLRVVNQYSGTAHDCTDAEAKETVGMLTKLNLTELHSKPDNFSCFYYKLRILTPAHEVHLYTDPGGYIRLDCIRKGAASPESVWYQMPAEDVTALIEYIEQFAGKSGLVTTAPPPILPATDKPITDVPDTNEPITGETVDCDSCTQTFADEYGKTGATLSLSRKLTADELADVGAFVSREEVQLAIAGGYESFYRPEDISLYQLMYASWIQREFPDNPYHNDGSMMTSARLKEIVRECLGIDITQAMWDRLIADGAEYFPAYDAYGFPHTDAAGVASSEIILGHLTEDGKYFVHLYDKLTSTATHVTVLLVPTEGSYRIEAVQWISP